MGRKSLALVLALTAWSVQGAPVTNGSFEQGLSGWETFGDASIQTSSIGTAPTHGSQFAVVSTLCGQKGITPCETSQPEEPYSQTNALNKGAYRVPTEQFPEGFFSSTFLPFVGVSLGTAEFAHWAVSGQLQFHGGGESSAIRQEIVAKQGSVVLVDYNFASSDSYDGLDQAVIAMFSSEVNYWDGELIGSTYVGFSPSAIDLCSQYLAQGNCNLSVRESGWRTAAFVVPFDGTFTIAAGVFESLEGNLPSVLLVDNVRLFAVPEPATLALLMLALVGLRVSRSRVSNTH